MIWLNICLTLLVILGVSYYVMIKRIPNKKYIDKVLGLCGSIITFLSLMILISINIPRNGIVNIDGGLRNGSDLIEGANESNFNLVFVSGYYVDNLFEKKCIELFKKGENPEFESYEKSVISRKEYKAVSSSMVDEAKNKAYVAAYKELGDALSYKKYLKVESVFANEVINTRSGLTPGDVINKVDGRVMNGRSELFSYINGLDDNKKVSLEVLREGKTVKLSFSPKEYGSNHSKLGFWVSEQFVLELPGDSPKFKTKMADQGDSAGLIIAIQVYDEISEKSLGKGLKIVGTGTIDENGRVGPIGGIDHKVTTSIKEGVDILFVPKENAVDGLYKQQLIADNKLKIVPVGSLREALDYLSK